MEVSMNVKPKEVKVKLGDLVLLDDFFGLITVLPISSMTRAEGYYLCLVNIQTGELLTNPVTIAHATYLDLDNQNITVSELESFLDEPSGTIRKLQTTVVVEEVL